MRQRRNECGLQSARELEALYPQFRTEQALEYARDSGVLYQERHHAGAAGAGPVRQHLRRAATISSSAGTRAAVVLHSPEYIPGAGSAGHGQSRRCRVVFAHPTVYKSMPLVRELAREGIIDGIEVDHPRNSPEDKAECAALCGQYGLIHTGGTDFHGANHKVPHPVGTCTTADDQVARIRGAGPAEKNAASIVV